MPQNVLGQVDADEHHLALARLIHTPDRAQIAAHQLVHALENHLALGVFHIEHAFVAQHAWPVDVDDGAEKVLQPRRIEGTRGSEYKAFDVVVHMVVVVLG